MRQTAALHAERRLVRQMDRQTVELWGSRAMVWVLATGLRGDVERSVETNGECASPQATLPRIVGARRCNQPGRRRFLRVKRAARSDGRAPRRGPPGLVAR